MNKLSTLCKGEAKKSIHLKGVVSTFLAIIVICILLTIAYQLFSTLINNPALQNQTPPVPYESYEQAIEHNDVVLRNVAKTKLENKLITKGEYRKEMYALDYNTTYYKYLRDNNLPLSTPLASLGSAIFYSGDTFSYSIMLMTGAFALVAIICIALVTTGITEEIKSGTLKLLLSRPVSKSKLLSAKFLTIFTYGVVLLLITTIVSVIIGAIQYKPKGEEMVMIFGACLAFKTTTVGVWFLTFFGMLIQLASYMLFARFIALLTRNKSATLIVCVVFLFLGESVVEALFTNFSIDWLLFSSSNSILALFSKPIYSFHFGVSIFLLIFYNALFIFLSHLLFHKSEY